MLAASTAPSTIDNSSSSITTYSSLAVGRSCSAGGNNDGAGSLSSRSLSSRSLSLPLQLYLPFTENLVQFHTSSVSYCAAVFPIIGEVIDFRRRNLARHHESENYRTVCHLRQRIAIVTAAPTLPICAFFAHDSYPTCFPVKLRMAQ